VLILDDQQTKILTVNEKIYKILLRRDAGEDVSEEVERLTLASIDEKEKGEDWSFIAPCRSVLIVFC